MAALRDGTVGLPKDCSSLEKQKRRSAKRSCEERGKKDVGKESEGEWHTEDVCLVFKKESRKEVRLVVSGYEGQRAGYADSPSEKDE